MYLRMYLYLFALLATSQVRYRWCLLFVRHRLGTPGFRKTTWPNNHFGIPLIMPSLTFLRIALGLKANFGHYSDGEYRSWPLAGI